VPAPISWIRYLSLSADGVLRFSWDDALFYRLAELKGNVLGYQSVPISGGIHQPAGTTGKVYHLGRFSNGIAVCEFPDDRNPLGFIEADARWIEAPELLDPPSIYDHAPVMNSKPYSALRWLLPRFWLPGVSLDGGGLLSAGIDIYLGDPLRRLEASLGADWDFRAHAVDMEVSATWSRFNSPVTVDLHDTFYSPFEGDITRVSGVSLGIGNAHPFFSGGALSWNVEASMTGLSLVSAGSPVYAPWTSFGTTFGTVLAWDDTLAPLHDAEAKTGYNAALRAQLDWDFTTVLPEAGFEASLQGFLEPMAIATKLYGAVAATTSIAYGPFGRSCAEGYTISGSYPVWTEFASGESGPLYTEGEASFRLFGTEIQKGIGAFYANRLSIRSGVRGYATINTSSTDWLSDHGWSAFGRASLTWTPSVGVWATIHPTSYIEFWFRPEMAGTPGRTHGASYMLVASY